MIIDLDVDGTIFSLEKDGISWSMLIEQGSNKYVVATAYTHKEIVSIFNKIMNDYIAGITKIDVLRSLKKRTIISEYKKLTEDIAVVKSRIKSVDREKSKLIYAYSPKSIGAIDYSKPAVQTSNVPISITDAYTQIHELEAEKKQLEGELISAEDQRNELEKIIDSLGDIEKKCIMLRIKGYTNYRIAQKLNYSVRGIEEIFKRTREKEKACGASVV